METNRNGRVPKGPSKGYNRKDDGDDDDDDDMSMGTICGDVDESSGESTNDDADMSPSELGAVQINKRSKVVPKRRKPNERIEIKKKNPVVNRKAKMKKSRFEFAYEAMDLSDEEDAKVMDKYKKCKCNSRNISKKLATIIRADTRKRKKKALNMRVEKRQKRSKPKPRPRRRVTNKKKSRNTNEVNNSPCSGNSTSENSRKETEQKSSKPAVQKENNNGDSSNNYSASNAEKKSNTVGDTRNNINEKPAADEKKATTSGKKAPCHGDINAKTSKDDVKIDSVKDSKTREKVDDLSKKVDKKEAKDMDEEINSAFPSRQSTRLRGFKRPTTKMMTVTSGKLPKKATPFIKFYMTVYRELHDTRSMRSITKEVSKRWKGMTAEEKNRFYTRKASLSSLCGLGLRGSIDMSRKLYYLRCELRRTYVDFAMGICWERAETLRQLL